jgi:DNA-binding winged helix-turn-helix (wHTH) protein
MATIVRLPTCTSCLSLREKLGIAEEHIKQLQEALYATNAPDPVLFYLTPLENRVYKFLAQASGRICTKEAIFNAMYFDAPGESSLPELKIVDVVICKIRQKLHAISFTGSIVTAWGSGYALQLGQAQDNSDILTAIRPFYRPGVYENTLILSKPFKLILFLLEGQRIDPHAYASTNFRLSSLKELVQKGLAVRGYSLYETNGLWKAEKIVQETA